MNKKQRTDLTRICQFIVNVYTPAYLWIYYHPSGVDEPYNILTMRDRLLSAMDSAVKQVISEAVKHIFIAHAITWFTPQNPGLYLLSESNTLTIQTVPIIRKQLTKEAR